MGPYNVTNVEGELEPLTRASIDILLLEYVPTSDHHNFNTRYSAPTPLRNSCLFFHYSFRYCQGGYGVFGQLYGEVQALKIKAIKRAGAERLNFIGS